MNPWLQRWRELVGRFNIYRFMPATVTLIVVCVLMLGAQYFKLNNLIESLELKTFDTRVLFQFGEVRNKPSKDIMILAFDDPTLSIYEEEFGTWPWPRSVHANMINTLNRWGARIIAYDMMFIGHRKGQEKDDQMLIDAFKNNKNVYLSMNFDNNKLISEQLGKGFNKTDLQNLDPLSINLHSNLQDEVAHTKTDGVGFYLNPDMTFNNFRRIMPELMSVQERIAFINHSRDTDGVSRKNPLVFRFVYDQPKMSQDKPYVMDPHTHQWQDAKGHSILQDGTMLDGNGKPIMETQTKFFPYLGLRLVLDLKVPKQYRKDISLTADGHLRFFENNVPLTADGAHLINWYNLNLMEQRYRQELAQWQYALANIDRYQFKTEGDKEHFRKKAENMINAYQAQLNIGGLPSKPYEEISAWQVLRLIERENKGQLTQADHELIKRFKNRIIFVGTTAVATYDIKTTPLDKLLPGVILQATVFDNLYQNTSYLKRLAPLGNALIAMGLCIATAAAILFMRSAVAGISTVFVLMLSYLTVAFIMFKTNNLWMNIAMPEVLVVTTALMTFILKYVSKSKAYEVTYRLATTDSMTGLYNYRFFVDYMNKCIVECNKQDTKFSLLLIDIDHFKKFNDTYGHQAGDEVLRQVAQKLKNSVRDNDVVCRYGGEEMAVILKKTGEAAALEVARKLVRLVGEEAYPIADGVSKHVTISMGVSTYPTHGKSMDEMVEFSDAGLYRAKENGRNQVGAQYDSPEDVARKAAEKSTEAHKPAEPAPAAEHATETVTSAPATAPEESPAPAVAENTIVILPPGSTASQSLFNPPMDSSGRK